jgi:transposase InsO family protein
VRAFLTELERALPEADLLGRTRAFLALHLDTRPRALCDFRGDEGPHHPHGKREPLASEEDPSRAREAKLGIRVSLATISRYLPKAEPSPGPHQRWMTFLRNHRDLISGMDFFVVPTVRFRPLYVRFVLDHGRRRLLHFNVTENPTAAWVIQQLREAFPDTPTHRFLIFDTDALFSAEVVASTARLGIRPKRTAYRSPWQNGTAERFVGSVRRELLDHVVVLSEDHLRRLLQEYVDYYNAERVHTSMGDAPAGRTTEARPSTRAQVAGLPRVGGLHHRYAWRDAA